MSKENLVKITEYLKHEGKPDALGWENRNVYLSPFGIDSIVIDAPEKFIALVSRTSCYHLKNDNKTKTMLGKYFNFIDPDEIDTDEDEKEDIK